MQEHLFDRPLTHLINALQRFPTIVQAHIDSRPPKIKHLPPICPQRIHMFVKRPQPSPGTTFRIWITLCQRSRQAHCRQVQARPPLLNCRENSKLVVLYHHVAKTHTTKAPRPPAPFVPPKTIPPALRVSRQTKRFILCHST